ncbi:type II toxin-antitoxin system RelE/ParE family toxin [Streptomyces sp. NPDC054865]
MTDPWPWGLTKAAEQQYRDLADHPAAPVPQDVIDSLLRRITADPYGAGSTYSPARPEWDRVAAVDRLVIPYQVHDPELNPQAQKRCVVVLRIVWTD